MLQSRLSTNMLNKIHMTRGKVTKIPLVMNLHCDEIIQIVFNVQTCALLLLIYRARSRNVIIRGTLLFELTLIFLNWRAIMGRTPLLYRSLDYRDYRRLTCVYALPETRRVVFLESIRDHVAETVWKIVSGCLKLRLTLTSQLWSLRENNKDIACWNMTATTKY